MTTTAQAQLSDPELACQDAETKIFQTFINRLDNSRAGAEWIGQNAISLARYACKKLRDKLLALDLSEKAINDFQLSLKQFLEQVEFSLYWGTYQILDSPEIPLVVDTEIYEEAFRLIQKGVSRRLSPETLVEIDRCFDYLIERLPLY